MPDEQKQNPPYEEHLVDGETMMIPPARVGSVVIDGEPEKPPTYIAHSQLLALQEADGRRTGMTAWKRSGELCRAMNERAAEQRRLYGRGARVTALRRPGQPRGRGPSGAPAGRSTTGRRAGASSRTASADPGDPEPEPAPQTPLRACKPPGGVYSFGLLTPAERGQEVVS